MLDGGTRAGPSSWPAVDRSIALRAGLGQAVSVTLVALLLGVLLPTAFFEDWGWLAGPGAWAACALAVGTWLGLAPLPVLAGAALAGLPSLAAVLAGQHWAGAPLGVLCFALWCGWLAGPRGARAVTA